MRFSSGLKTAIPAAALAVFFFASEAWSQQRQDKKKREVQPAVAVIQQDGKEFERRCYRDTDKNGFCDRGSKQKGKCQNNCRLNPKKQKQKPDDPKQEKKYRSGKEPEEQKQLPLCAACPLAGNCSGACAALLTARKSAVRG